MWARRARPAIRWSSSPPCPTAPTRPWSWSRRKPSVVHAGLLALGAKPGHPVRFDAEFHPATGTEIAIEVRWKDDKGKVQSAAAQKWIRNMRTKEALDVNWVFAGSGFRKDPETGQQRYFGDSGDFISVSNLPTATLDLPINSTKTMESRLFEGALDQMPPAKTPVTIVLKPKLEGRSSGGRASSARPWNHRMEILQSRE